MNIKLNNFFLFYEEGLLNFLGEKNIVNKGENYNKIVCFFRKVNYKIIR